MDNSLILDKDLLLRKSKKIVQKRHIRPKSFV